MKRSRWMILILLILLLTAAWSSSYHWIKAAPQGSTFELVRSALTNGGGHLSGDLFTLDSSIGQANAAVSQGGSFELRSGIVTGKGIYYVYLPLTRR